MPTTTTVPVNQVQRVLDTCSAGTLGVTFLDDGGVRLTDCRLSGLAYTIPQPTPEAAIVLPAPAVDVETLNGFESRSPVEAPVLEEPAVDVEPDEVPVDELAPLVDPAPVPPAPPVVEETPEVPPVEPEPEVTEPTPEAAAVDLGNQADPAV